MALCLVQSVSQQQEAAGIILVLLAKGQEPEASLGVWLRGSAGSDLFPDIFGMLIAK